MCVTKHGVYLVTEEEEFYLGTAARVLAGHCSQEFPGEGRSFQAVIMDIVQEIASDSQRDTKTVTIEIR